MARSCSESVSAQLGGFRDRNCLPSLSQASIGLAACEHPRRRSWRPGVEARKIEGSIAEYLTGTQGLAQLEVLSTVINMPFCERHSDCLCTEVMETTTVKRRHRPLPRN
jgi:hypothetical protein